MDSELQICTNCKKEIPTANYSMHIVHCQRNFTVCKQCNDAISIAEYKNHIATAHKKVRCKLCKNQFENCKLEEHAEICPKRVVKCDYCELEFAFEELEEHKNYCGSRTDLCDDCGQYVMLKDMNVHIASGHPILQKPRAAKSESHPGGATVDTPKEDLSRQLFSFTRRQPQREENLETDSASTHRRSPNDLDQLLALQLQDDDRNQIFFEDPNPFSLLANSPFLGTDPVSLVDEVFHRRARSHGTPPSIPRCVQIRRSSPHEANVTPETFDEPLPCEYCGELFPNSMLLQHQSICSPENHQRNVDQEIENELVNRISGLDLNEQSVVLPCDHCKMQFPEEMLIQHEETCPFNLLVHNEERAVLIPCDHCKQQFPGEVLLKHEEICPKNPLLNYDDTVVTLPCDHCHTQFPEEMLLQHEEMCPQNPVYN